MIATLRCLLHFYPILNACLIEVFSTGWLLGMCENIIWGTVLGGVQKGPTATSKDFTLSYVNIQL